jgi:hypothetical protein
MGAWESLSYKLIEYEPIGMQLIKNKKTKSFYIHRCLFLCIEKKKKNLLKFQKKQRKEKTYIAILFNVSNCEYELSLIN